MGLFSALKNFDNNRSLKKLEKIASKVEALADKFEALSKEYHPSQESINEAFDELKRIYKGLWI